MLKVIPVLIALIFAATQAMADQIKVGVINLKPWGSVSDNRELVGQHIDFFNELSKRTGMQFEYSILTIPRIKELIKSGEIDMTIIFKRDEMAPYVDFLGLVMPYNYYLVGKSGALFDEESVKKLTKVGFIEGEEDVAKKCFSDKFNDSAKMYPAPNYGNLLKMLNKSRIEGATIPSKGLKAYLDEIGEEKSYTNKLFILCENEAFLQVSKKSKTLQEHDLTRLSQTLSQMREDHTIEQIAEKYAEVKN